LRSSEEEATTDDELFIVSDFEPTSDEEESDQEQTMSWSKVCKEFTKIWLELEELKAMVGH